MSEYERVRFEGRTIIVRNPRVIEMLGGLFLTGVEVNNEGDEVTGRGSDERVHIIGLNLVTKRTPLRWDVFYGCLEEKESPC